MCVFLHEYFLCVFGEDGFGVGGLDIGEGLHVEGRVVINIFSQGVSVTG